MVQRDPGHDRGEREGYGTGEGGSPIYPPPSYSSPPSYGSISPVPNSTKPAASIFDAWPGPEVDQAKTEVSNFMSWLGFPTGVDADQLAVRLLKSGDLNHGQVGYEDMFFSDLISDDQRKNNPWARFGMDRDTFTQQTAKLDSMFTQLIGSAPDRDWVQSKGDPSNPLQSLYHQALTQGLSQSDVLARLQKDPDLVAAQPWLAQGQGYATAQQQFSSLYSPNPVDTSTLAAWWRFNTGAASLSRTARPVTETVGPLMGGQSEVR